MSNNDIWELNLLPSAVKKACSLLCPSMLDSKVHTKVPPLFIHFSFSSTMERHASLLGGAEFNLPKCYSAWRAC